MPAMRVHELAKEFGMTSKELLDRLAELRIPAKNHASTLVDAYVDKIRKQLGPEIAERQQQLEEERAKEAAAEAIRAQAAEKARKAAEDERRKAEEAERARRDEEQRVRAEEADRRRAEEEAARHAVPAPVVPTPAPKPAPAPVAAPAPTPAAKPAAATAKAAPKAAPKTAAKAKPEPVAVTPEPAAEPVAAAAPPVMDARANLEAAIAAERTRLEAEAGAALNKEEEDRYRQMAVDAEELQRQKVLDEAKAAVAAAAVEGSRKKKKHKKPVGAEVEEAQHHEAATHTELPVGGDAISVTEGVTVGEFADALEVPSSDIIKRLFLLGTPLTVNQAMSNDIIEIIGEDLGREVRVVSAEEEINEAFVFHDEPEDLKPRPPVVTVMGHVDHGKSSLLDAIRETGVAATEAGGITQHIGASVVNKNGRQITFIDTPGHEAFTAMRARGANATDIVVLVVAADDGVMPQTVEAIHHAQAAGVPIIVAVNKIDKDGANPEQVRQMLTEYEIVPEEWGGTNIFVNVSAKKRLHIDDLLEMILLQADVLELKANPDTIASGVVIEAKLDKGRGPVATVLVQRGTLHVGDAIVAGTGYGTVRALVSPKGDTVKQASPADPVEIQGLASVPSAGDEFRVYSDARDARNLAEERALKLRLAAQEKKTHVSLDDLFARISEGALKEVNLVVKADAQGSIEALKDSLDKMDQSEVVINVIHSAVGAISESDITLADASDAIVIGFNVRPQPKAKALAEEEGVDVRLYRVIYQAIEDINAARVGMLAPEFHEEDTARIEVRDLFRVPKAGVIAGCYVQEGEISRDDKIRIVRDGTIIHDGTIHSLRRFKDDVKSVRQGFECGIGVDNFQDIKEGDIIEGYKIIEVARES
ncbi:MAG: translation initiation factor IF-2 [Coriobacteriia bacterium]|nr:translation initiation factor IF-2 [Coriobacteriia bacterium]